MPSHLHLELQRAPRKHQPLSEVRLCCNRRSVGRFEIAKRHVGKSSGVVVLKVLESLTSVGLANFTWFCVSIRVKDIKVGLHLTQYDLRQQWLGELLIPRCACG